MKVLRVISLLVLAGVLSGMPACMPTYSYDELTEFARLEFTSTGVTRTGPEGNSPSIYVAANSNSPVPEWAANHMRFFGTGRVDLNKNLLIIVSRGVTDFHWNLIVVTDIWQTGKTVLVRAQILNWPENLAVPKSTVHPADVVIVSKDQIAGSGEFVFRLMNDRGVVVASTQAIIRPISGEE
jgi:hypothetical protein